MCTVYHYRYFINAIFAKSNTIRDAADRNYLRGADERRQMKAMRKNKKKIEIFKITIQREEEKRNI